MVTTLAMSHTWLRSNMKRKNCCEHSLRLWNIDRSWGFVRRMGVRRCSAKVEAISMWFAFEHRKSNVSPPYGGSCFYGCCSLVSRLGWRSVLKVFNRSGTVCTAYLCGSARPCVRHGGCCVRTCLCNPPDCATFLSGVSHRHMENRDF
jgi:hypothetical protein